MTTRRLVYALALLLVLSVGYHVYAGVQYIRQALAVGALSGYYLYGEAVGQTPDGESINRAQLIDELLKQRFAAAPQEPEE